MVTGLRVIQKPSVTSSLKIMVEEGVIDKLELQPEYKIMLKNQHITTYRGDFRYAVLDDMGRIKKVVLEDVKGMVTDVYLIKKKLVEAEYGIKIHRDTSLQGKSMGWNYTLK